MFGIGFPFIWLRKGTKAKATSSSADSILKSLAAKVLRSPVLPQSEMDFQAA
jgi:hypothetical protein